MSTESTRRAFLKQGAVSGVSLLVLSGCAPGREETPDASAPGLDASMLRSVAEVVLPSELGPDGAERVVLAFERWLRGYAPVPELLHGYGSQEIRYGPGDPAPRWSSQLAALDIESRKRWGRGFGELPVEDRREMVRRNLVGQSLQRLPNPTQVEHIGAAILTYWLATPEATNLCYGRTIDPYVCRPLGLSSQEPPVLGGAGD